MDTNTTSSGRHLIDQVAEEEEDKYLVSVRCHNCGNYNADALIPRGTQIVEFFKGRLCQACGCKGTLHRDTWPWPRHIEEGK